VSNALFLLQNYFDLGTVTASSEASASLAATNLQDSQRSMVWRSGNGSTSYVNCTLPANYGINYAAVVDCNMRPTGTIRVQSWSDALGGASPGEDTTVNPTVYLADSTTSIYGSGSYGLGGFGGTGLSVAPLGRNITLIPLSQAWANQRYWRFTFTDTSGTYQQAGRLFLGTPLEFGVNMSYGWRTGRREESTSKFSLGGQRYTQAREKRQTLSGVFQYLADAERTLWLQKYNLVGDVTPVIFSVYPEATQQGLTTTVYCTLEGPEVAGDFYDVNSLNFAVNEEL
jgi:hypothetical protein